jgi:hypothetical protein
LIGLGARFRFARSLPTSARRWKSSSLPAIN